MKLFSFLALAMAAVAQASSVSWVPMEDIASHPAGWERGPAVARDQLLEVTLAVKQTNTDALEQRLLEVSDPDNVDLYGQHMTRDEVNEFVKPTTESVAAVREYLARHGADKHTMTASPNSDFITAVMPAHLVERMFKTHYHVYKHAESGIEVTRATSYRLPSDVAEHIDFATPTVRFPVVQKSKVTGPAAGVRALKGFGGIITPTILRELYKVPTTAQAADSSKNIQACASFLGQFYSPSDLQTFFNMFDHEAKGRTPSLFGPNTASQPGVEASLDIQYIMGLGNNVKTQFWSTSGQQPGSPQNEPFLKWLTVMSGHDDSTMPKTVSVSYGDNEPTVNRNYATRVNTEFKKLGMRGVSIMFSSGDGGVSGGQQQPCTTFVPTYPAGSPWVTAVGGTSSSKPEVAAGLSSGGFSNYWARPSYQKEAVAHYFKVAQNLPPAHLFNQTGAGIPDVSAQAESFNVVVGGTPAFGGVSGTSCASPTFTGIMSLVNELRIAAGKSTLGFLNPLFYKHPEMFNDITSGTNPGCNMPGFSAAQGWDPVTGLGSPNYEAMKKVVEALP